MVIKDHLTKKHTTAREPITPKWIVLHDTEGVDSLDWLAYNPDAVASVQYLIARSGTIYRIGLETWACWHAGRTRWDGSDVSLNYSSVGIEIEHRSGVENYPPAQITALENLILDIAGRWNISSVLSHKEIAYPRGRKSDPQLDVTKYSIEAVRARLGNTEDIPMNAEQDKRLRDVEAAVVALAKSARASSFRESIAIAVALGDYATADRLNLEAKAAGFVTGYTRP